MRPLDDDDVLANLSTSSNVRNVNCGFAAQASSKEDDETKGVGDVEAGLGFIEDEDVGIVQQCGGDEDALLNSFRDTRIWGPSGLADAPAGGWSDG